MQKHTVYPAHADACLAAIMAADVRAHGVMVLEPCVAAGCGRVLRGCAD